jgi:hypothetical protein
VVSLQVLLLKVLLIHLIFCAQEWQCKKMPSYIQIYMMQQSKYLEMRDFSHFTQDWVLALLELEFIMEVDSFHLH